MKAVAGVQNRIRKAQNLIDVLSFHVLLGLEYDNLHLIHVLTVHEQVPIQ
jgi:hypothetical protein